MLRELRRQASEVAAAEATATPSPDHPFFELLVVYDSSAFETTALNDLLQGCLGAPDAALGWRLLPAQEGGYYRNKDLGARAAAGAIVVFIDSDAIPEPGWLSRMVIALGDPAVAIVAGSTYIEPSGLVGKVFALAWFFPLRSVDGPLHPVDSFFVNNLALRRACYLAHPLPELEGTSRGACLVLANQLQQAGIPVHGEPRARVAHPAPNGFTHIFKRALAQGRDRLYRERAYGSRWSAFWPASCWRWLRHLGGSTAKICTRCRRVGLHPLQIPPALALAWYYYTLYWMGEMLLHLRVPAIRRIRV
jgi:hypothetical protein